MGAVELVVGAALPAARDRVSPLGQRHRSDLLLEAPERLERRQTRVGLARLAPALGDVAVAAAHRAEPAAVGTAERLHRQGQIGLAPEEPRDVQDIPLVEVHLQIVPPELDLPLPVAGLRHELEIDHGRRHGSPGARGTGRTARCAVASNRPPTATLSPRRSTRRSTASRRPGRSPDRLPRWPPGRSAGGRRPGSLRHGSACLARLGHRLTYKCGPNRSF